MLLLTRAFIRALKAPPIAPSALSDFRAVGQGGASRRHRGGFGAGLRGFKRKQFRQAKLKQFALTSNSLARAGLGRGWARLGEAGRGWARLGQAGPGLGQGWARAGPELDQAGVRMRGLGEWGWASRFQGQNHEPQFQNCEAQPPNPEAQSQKPEAQTPSFPK